MARCVIAACFKPPRPDNAKWNKWNFWGLVAYLPPTAAATARFGNRMRLIWDMVPNQAMKPKYLGE